MSSLPISDDWVPDPDWPVVAIPQRWVEALFSTMAGCYGARFADLWRGTKIEQVKRLWGIELSKLSSQQMKAGRENLMALPKPPTLPEFVALCKQARQEQASATAPQLTNEKRADQATVDENLGRIRQFGNRIMAKTPTAEWAYTLVIRGKSASGAPLPFEVLRCATDAITSQAGRLVVENCIDPELKQQYADIRQTVIDDYRMRGMRLWDVR
jgi:hypothetical protein